MVRRPNSLCPQNTEFEYCEHGSIKSLVRATEDLELQWGIIGKLRFAPNISDTFEMLVMEIKSSSMEIK